MPLPNIPLSNGLSHEERAFFARLAALNGAIESSKAGNTAQRFCANAQSSDALLAAFLKEIQAIPKRQ